MLQMSNRLLAHVQVDIAKKYPVQLSKTSVLGLFVRRCVVEYRKLDFVAADVVWRSYCDYIAPICSRMTSKFLRHSSAIQSILKHTGQSESYNDLQGVIEFQIEQLHRFNYPLDKVESRLKQHLAVPYSNHYLQFLRSWQAGDYQGTFENLHLYFDHSMQTRDRPFYQYALLNLAIVLGDFNCIKEAKWAMQETINTAREVQDEDCLQYALAWMQQYDTTGDQSSHSSLPESHQVLRFLKHSAKKANQPYSQAMVHLAEAKELFLEVSRGL